MRSEAADERPFLDAHAARPRPLARLLAFRHQGFLAPAPHRGGDDASDRAGHRDRADAARPQPGWRSADPWPITDRNHPASLHYRQRLAHEDRHAGGDRGLCPRRKDKTRLRDRQQFLLHRGGAGVDLRDPEAFFWSLAPWPTATERRQMAVGRPTTARPIRSRTTPMTWWWSAPAARACVPWSAAAKRDCAPPASQKCFRPARTR